MSLHFNRARHRSTCWKLEIHQSLPHTKQYLHYEDQSVNSVQSDGCGHEFRSRQGFEISPKHKSKAILQER